MLTMSITAADKEQGVAMQAARLAEAERDVELAQEAARGGSSEARRQLWLAEMRLEAERKRAERQGQTREERQREEAGQGVSR